MRYAQLVMGPAGSGKSTYCSNIVKHCETIKRTVYVINLDPAAEYFDYPVVADIRELIQVDDVMDDQDLHLGPNGGLVFCMEYLLNNLHWLEEKLGFVEDDYFIFDCPGQIELYTHFPIMKNLIDHLQKWDIRPCGVYLVDSQFMIDAPKFISGTMSALSCMVNLEIPHVNIMSKMDLIGSSDKENIERYLNADCESLAEELDELRGKKFHKLNLMISRMIEDYSLVKFISLNFNSEDSVAAMLYQIDSAIQYDEDRDITNQVHIAF